MPERLPTFGESPYYNILVPWLRVDHAADGTHDNIHFPDPGVANKSISWNGGGAPALTSHGSANGLVLRVTTGNNDVTIFRAQTFAGTGEIGNLNFEVANDAGGQYRAAGLFGQQVDRTVGVEKGYLQLKTMYNGAYTERVRVGDTSIPASLVAIGQSASPFVCQDSGGNTLFSIGSTGIVTAPLSQAHRFGSGSDFVAPTNNAWTLAVSGVIVPGLGQPGYGFISAPNFTKHSSGTHAQFVNAELDFPHVTNPAAGGAVTDIVAVRVGADAAPPYSDATNVYAIQVVNGIVKLGGTVASTTQPALLLGNNTYQVWKDSTDALTNAGFVLFDASNQLALGAGNLTRVVITATGTVFLRAASIAGFDGAAGRLVQSNNTAHFWADAAGGSTNAMFVQGSSNNDLLFGTGNATRLILTNGGGLLFSDTDPGFANANGRFTQRNNTHHFWIDAAGGATNAMFVQGDSSNNLNFGTGNTTRVTITQGGQVQLGTDVKFGTNTAKGAEAFASFITITDAGGTPRKLMVCA